MLRLYYRLFKLAHPNTPWTSQASIVFFQQALNNNMTGFEFGSGISTAFFAARLGALISLEHDKAWYEKVRQELAGKNLKNVTYQLIQKADDDGVVEESVTLFGKNFRHAFTGAYYTYSSAISQYPDNHFDFILVDGRARVDCIIRSLPKLKPGGILVLDNSERTRYSFAHEILKEWPTVFTTTGVTDTTIWFKPIT